MQKVLDKPNNMTHDIFIMSTNERLSSTIKERRQQLRLSQDALADKAGVSRSTVYRVEVEMLPIRLASERLISEALGWSADAFDAIKAGLEPIISTSGELDDLSQIRRDIAEIRSVLETIISILKGEESE